MTSSAPSWRSVAIAFGVFVLIVAALIVWFTGSDARAVRAPLDPAPATSVVSAPQPQSHPVQTATPSFAVLNPSAAPEPSPRKKLLPTDPDPPPPEGLHSIAVGSRDPFEAKGDDGLRVVASYGAIKIGIAKKAHVRDEQQVAAITLALAKELNEKESGRKDDFETRAHEYQPILGGYAAKLQPYMTGEFAFHAGDWILFHSVKDPGAKAP